MRFGMVGMMMLALAVTSMTVGASAHGEDDSGENPALQPLKFQPLPLGSIIGAGWLRRQLEIQANGQTGNLESFWPDIKDSGWIGGKAEGWERAPYWLDGFIPLAYTLDDPKHKATVKRWMDYIIEHQREDGWFGPEKSAGYKAYDTWPTFIVLKALRQYYEVTREERVLEAMLKSSRKIEAVLKDQPLFDWGKYRWMDLVLTLHWLHEQTGEKQPLRLAELAQKQGFDWLGHFTDFKFREKMPADKCILDTHVVNNAMAVKAPCVWYRQSREARDAAGVDLITKTLDTLHGQATGILTGDEHYAGNSPSQGTETCAVVEYMFSLENALAILGNPVHADRLERIAYNALPGAFTPDMWAHQYVQQANQVICRVSKERVYTNNGPDANLFGLEPNYGCCTANYHQGWPKLTAHLWMKAPDGGLAAMVYAPCALAATVQGKPVGIEVRTQYPFRDEVTVVVRGDGTFPIHFRVPGWTEGASIALKGTVPTPMQPGGFHTLTRPWKGETTVILKFPMPAKVERRFNQSATFSRGPLVYSLRVGTYWKHLRGEAPHNDFEVFPTTPWNYAVKLDAVDPTKSIRFEELPMGDNPFDPATPPVCAFVNARLLPDWIIEQNAAATLPVSPVTSTQDEQEVELIPYGAAKLRVTEFPVLKD